jgi:cyclic pyranopterin phosphate synthase
METNGINKELIDPFGRRIDYLRVSVTDRCNYRCFYCMPPEGIKGGKQIEFLSYEEMTRIIRLFSELGVHKIRFTGGEPLVRRNVIRLIEQVGALSGITDLSLSTNAHLLGQHAQALKDAGLNRVNISIDSLDAKNFSEITRGGDLATVIHGIDAALKADLRPVKLNMVVMKGINDHEIEGMLDFAHERGADLRFIETMPVGSSGRDGVAHYYPAEHILERVKHHYGSELLPFKVDKGAGPAKCYKTADGLMKVGIITAMSQHFCEACNRVRLGNKGDLLLCLGQNDSVSLRDALRDGCSDEELMQLIRAAINKKPERHNFMDGDNAAVMHDMSTLGG